MLKAAIFAADANWGRILCAIGYADAEFDIMKIDVDLVSKFGKIRVCEKGFGVEFDEDYAYKVLSEEEIQIRAEECRVGKECCRLCISRWWQYH